MFFVLNSKFHWLTPSEVTLSLSSAGPRAPLPPELVSEVLKHYAAYQPVNSDVAAALNGNRHTAQRFDPFSVHRLILRNPVAVRQIRDRVHNLTYNRSVYDVTYNFDERGRRDIPGQKYNPRGKNLVLIGCSFTFGTGVPDGETMPYFLRWLRPTENIYNLGIPGAGMSELLDEVRVRRRLEDMNRNGGAVVYTFIYDHLERTFCSLDCYRPERRNWILDRKGEYVFGKDGEPVNLGIRSLEHPWRTAWLATLAASEFLNFIGWDRPHIYDEKAQETYARFVIYLHDQYRQKGLRFYFFDYDGTGRIEPLLTRLRAAGVDIITSPPPLPGVNEISLKIIGDGHFNAVGNHYLAAAIHNGLGQEEKK